MAAVTCLDMHLQARDPHHRRQVSELSPSVLAGTPDGFVMHTQQHLLGPELEPLYSQQSRKLPRASRIITHLSNILGQCRIT